MLALHLLRELQSFHAFTSILTEHYKLLCDGINCLQPFNKALMSEVYECGGMCITYMMWFSVTTTCDALYSTGITSVSFERCIVHDLAFSRNSVGNTSQKLHSPDYMYAQVQKLSFHESHICRTHFP